MDARMTMTGTSLSHGIAARLQAAKAAIRELEKEPIHYPEPPDAVSRSTTPDDAEQPDWTFSPRASLLPQNFPVAHVSKSPIHPIPSMQEEFEESILDSAQRSSHAVKNENNDAEARRRQLLELDHVSEEYSSRWRPKPGSKYHPLRKLVAQISYGIYLLHNRKAISEKEVLRILQAHVDEIDSFVEDTLADFELATKDIVSRIEHLMVPLEHSRTFNRMLCDRDFRKSIMEGNEIIERVIGRTSFSRLRAMNDVTQGLGAVVDLIKYLKDIEKEWQGQAQHLVDVYDAMKGNAEGWFMQFKIIGRRSNELERLMLRLGFIVDEIGKRCGVASRRKTPVARLESRDGHQPPQSSFSTQTFNPAYKPLPPPPRRTTTDTASLATKASSSTLKSDPKPPALSSSSRQIMESWHKPMQSPAIISASSGLSSPPKSSTVRFSDAVIPQSPSHRLRQQPSSRSLPYHESGVQLAKAFVEVGAAQDRPHTASASAAPTRQHTASLPEAVPTAPLVHDVSSGQTTHQLALSRSEDSAVELPHVQASNSDDMKITEVAPRPPTLRLMQSESNLQVNARPAVPRTPTTPTFSVFPRVLDPKTQKPLHNAPRTRSSGTPSIAGGRARSSTSTASRLSREMFNSFLSTEAATTTKVFIEEPSQAQSPPEVSPQLSVDTSPEKANVVVTPASPADSGFSDNKSKSAHIHTPPNHTARVSVDTVSTSSPQTPEGPIASSGLRSHPVDNDPHDPRYSIITALPTVFSKATLADPIPRPSSSTLSTSHHGEVDSQEPRKRTLGARKPSLAAMKTLFSRKTATRGTSAAAPPDT